MALQFDRPMVSKLLLVLFSAVIVMSSLLGSSDFRRMLFSESTPGVLIFENELDNGAPGLREATEITGNPLFAGPGIGVQPGEQFSIRWTGNLAPGDIPYLRVWLVNGAETDVRVTFELGDQTETLALPGQYTGLIIWPKTFKPTSDRAFYHITLTSSLSATAREPLLVLDRVQAGHKVFAEGSFKESYWGALIAALVPWALYEILLYIRGRKQAVWAAGAATLFLSAMLGLLPASYAVVGFLSIAVVVCSSSYLLYKNHDPESSHRFEWLLICGLMGMALWMRWAWLSLLAGSPLFPDAQHYFGLVSTMKWPYDTGFREPFLMWPIWVIQLLTAESELAQRLTTILISIAEGVALYWLCREFMKVRYAWIAPVLFAFNPALASNAVLGLREEALPLGWMIFLLGLVRTWKGQEGYRPHVLMGIGAAIAILTRLNTAAALVPIYVIAWAIKRWNFKAVAVTGVLSAALILPHMINHTIVYGDPFKSMNLYQVSDVTKPPPNKEVEEKKSILGRMFGHERFVPLTAKGSWNMLGGWSARNSFLRLNATPQTDRYFYPASLSHYSTVLAKKKTVLDHLLYGFYLVGAVGLLFRRGGWIIITSLLLFVVPISFILEVADIREPRMLMNHVPLMLLIVAAGISIVVEGAIKLLTRKTVDVPDYGRSGKGSGKHQADARRQKKAARQAQ